MPSATFTHAVHVQAPIEELWTALQDPRTWEHVGPVEKVWDPETDANGTLLGYRWSTSIGGKEYLGHARTVDHRRPGCFMVDLDGGEMGGRLRARMTPAEDGTDVEVDLEIRTQGMMSAVLFPVIRGAIASGFPDQVEELAARLAARD